MTKDNKNKVLNVPTLRFPEFSGEWEKCKLGEIVIRITRKNRNNESKLPLTISAQYGLVDQISFFNKIVASSDMSNYYLLYNGEFAYNKSYSGDYPWGAIKRLNKYDKGALSSLYICFAPKDNIESNFLVHYFESSKWNKEVSNIAGEGARNHGLLNISVEDFFNTKHWITLNYNEQKKIGNFLNLITERIETQKKIIDKYESLIKGIIDSAILNKHQNVIIQKVCKVSEQTKVEPDINKILTVRLHCNGVYKSNAENLQLGATQYYHRTAGQLIYGKQNFHNGAISIIPDNLDGGITSKDIPSFDIDYTQCNPIYLLSQLQSPKYYKKAEALTTGTGSKRLKEETFLKMGIVLPPLSEQNNIAKIISRVTKNIDYNKKLLQLFCQQKQYLFRQMFI